MRTYFILLFLAFPSVLFAQQTVKGKVSDSEGVPLPGVTVLIKDTPKGVSTTLDGLYSIEVAPGATLRFSFIGFKTQEVVVGASSEINVTLEEEAAQLSEVVITTALGIKKEKKSLGYAATAIKSVELNRVKASNVVNALAGKVAGVQVTGASNGVASSSRIVIRGENSLSLDSNSPLFIIDGMPVNNRIFGVGGTATDQADLPTDYGNGMSELNSDDFESVTVLKGAAASALYGARAANGVIVITTKTGEKPEKGIGVSISSQTLFSRPLRLPTLQTEYGGGWGKKYASDYGTNFGPKLDGSQVAHETARGEKVTRPFVNRYDLNDFFRTGLSQSNTIALSGATERANYYLSFGNVHNEGIVPNTNLKGHSFRLNTSYKATDKLTLRAHANYISRKSDNLTVAGYGSQGIMYALLWNYNNVGLKELKQYWEEPHKKQRKLFSWADNPWFIVHENINAFKKKRFLGNLSLNYTFDDHWSLMLRIGADESDDFRWSRRPIGAHRFPKGMYREQKINFSEVNSDFLLTYQNNFGDFSLKTSAGGNIFNQKITKSFLQGNALTIPAIYNAQNISIMPDMGTKISEKKINSLYAFANVGYKKYLYADFSVRNDWSSTLPPGNNTYFYPALSLSFVPTSAFPTAIPEAIDFLKLRVNIAQVGKDTDPYRLKKTYKFGKLPGTLTNPSQLLNPNLKPERTTSTEFGLEVYLLRNRFMLDFTYYNALSKDQILEVRVSGANGYTSLVKNAGEIRNAGIELAANVKIIETNRLRWQVNANFTKNKSEVKSLASGLNTFVIAEGPNDITIEARPGAQMGDIYGNTYTRNKNGDIVYNKGLPITGKQQKVGNYNPDWMLGLSTQVGYKRFWLSAQLDIRHGGRVYSYTNAIGQESGMLARSLPGREKGIVGKGVVKNPDGTYSPNTQKVSAETWYYGGAYPRNNAEVHTFDASYLKLRQLSVGYDFPQKIIRPLGLQALSLSLIGSNLLLHTKVPNIDPEAQSLNGGSLLPGIEVVQIPSKKAYGFKINLKF